MILELGFALAGIVGGTHIYNGLTKGRKVEYKRVRIHANKIEHSLDNYKIGFITDIHRSPEKRIKSVVNFLKKEKVDLLLLGGDFPRNTMRMLHVLRSISEINPKDGIMGVQGNHDNHKYLYPAMRSFGMISLDNEGQIVAKGLFVGGVADLKRRKSDVDSALENAVKSDFNILVCHNPDTTMMQDTSRANLTLCGHTHGGEVSLYGKWAPTLTIFSEGHGVTNYGEKFAGGFTKSASGTSVYVSRGLGNHLPMRIYTRPEVTVFELVKEK